MKKLTRCLWFTMLLIPALGDLARRRKDFVFVLAGSGNSNYEAEVAALVKRHELEDRTVFLGLVAVVTPIELRNVRLEASVAELGS